MSKGRKKKVWYKTECFGMKKKGVVGEKKNEVEKGKEEA